MNEEVEDIINEIKKTLPYLLVAALAVGGYYWIKDYRENRRNAASTAVAEAFSSDELEDAIAKFGGTNAEGALRLRLAKSYYDASRYEEALAVYEELATKAPVGFQDIPAVGKAQCLEALGKYKEAADAFDAFVASASEDNYLRLTAQLGAARAVAQDGNREMAVERLNKLLADAGDDAVSKARIESTLDLVKRYEKRAEVSLFDAADAAAKQLEKENAPAEAAPAAEKAE